MQTAEARIIPRSVTVPKPTDAADPANKPGLVPQSDYERKIAKWIGEEFERYQNHWADKFSSAEKDYDHWIGKPPIREYDHQNAVHVPLTFEAEQTITPRIFTALFPNDAPVDVQVEGDSEPMQGTKIKNLIQHFFRVNDVQGEALPMLTQNAVYGTAYLDGGSWFVRRAWMTGQDQKRYYTIVESRPYTKHVDFFEMFPHPDKMEMGDNLPLIRRQFVEAEYIKSLAENPYHKFNNIELALNSEVPKWFTNKKGPSHFFPRKGEEYELLSFWGPLDPLNDPDEKNQTSKLIPNVRKVPYWTMIVNRKVCIRCMPNPYNHQMPPYIKTKMFDDAMPSWFGIGVAQAGRASQERVNKIVNTRLDNVDLIINKMGFYNGNDTMISVRKLQVSKPGLWHKVSDTQSSIRWMDTPDVTQSSYEEEQIAKNDFREATGATSSMMPADDVKDQHRTAMGIQLLQGAAGVRFRPLLRKLETSFIQNLAMFYFSNLQQFMAEDQWIQVTGEEGGTPQAVKVSPEDIQAKVYFIPTGISETLNKETQVGQLLRFKEITLNDPTVNRQEINKRIAELMGFKDIPKLLVANAPQQTQGLIDQPTGQNIMRRLKEGASPAQIKHEMIGPKPPSDQGAWQQG